MVIINKNTSDLKRINQKPNINVNLIPTGKFHKGISIYIEAPKFTRYPGPKLVELRKQKGIGNIRKIKVI